MGLMQHQDKDRIRWSVDDTLHQEPDCSSCHYSPRCRVIIWALACVVSWLAGLGVIKLIIMVIDIFRTARITP
jgi:hypothetical protein